MLHNYCCILSAASQEKDTVCFISKMTNSTWLLVGKFAALFLNGDRRLLVLFTGKLGNFEFKHRRFI